MAIVKNLLRKLVRWATSDDPCEEPIRTVSSGHESTATIRIGVIDAVNGTVLEVSAFKRNPHGPDWTSKMFIVREDQPLHEAIAMLLLSKGTL